MELEKVKAVQDDSCHWYVLPVAIVDKFYTDLDNEAFVDCGDFDVIYGRYMTGGNLNLIQLYADLKS